MYRQSVLIQILVIQLAFSFIYGYSYLEDLMKKVENKCEPICEQGFFCNTGVCIAKRQEGEHCVNRNEECACGKCHNGKCSSWYDCENNGETNFNNCQENSECPNNYFCDTRGNYIKRNYYHKPKYVCTSKLNAGVMCTHDSQCKCGKCIEHKRTHGRYEIVSFLCDNC